MRSRHSSLVRTRVPTDDIVIRPPQLADEVAVLDAWHACFARLDPAAHLEASAWRRRWSEHPLGWQAQAAFAADGTCLAHFGGLGFRWRTPEGGLRRGWVVVDSFARIEARGGLGKRGWLARCCERFIAESMSREQRDYAHGFPVPRAWELGRRVMRYEFADEVRVWTASSAALQPWPTPLEARSAVLDERIARLDAQVYARTARIERNAAHLAWRLPADAQCVEVRAQDGALRGFAAWRTTTFLGEPHLVLLDWVVDAADAPAQGALLAAARNAVRTQGATRVAVWGSPRDPHAGLWWRLGLRLRALENVQACFVPHDAHEARRVASELYLSFLDTDLA